MYNFGRKPTVANCTFAENSATEEGGGVYNNASTMTMINCTVIRNSATNGGGMYKEDIGSLSSLTVINCILWENAPNQIVTKIGNAIISYSNIQNGWLYGEGNLAVDPNFADIDNGDYHLQSQAERWDPSSRSWVQDKDTSPCIDTGDPDTPVGDEPLPNGGRINMGAYGGTAQASKSPE
jgi:predicted outer membrane repeat protein